MTDPGRVDVLAGTPALLGSYPDGAMTAFRSAHGAPVNSVGSIIRPCRHSCDPPAISAIAMVLLVPSATSSILWIWLVTSAPWLPPFDVSASAITTGGFC